MSEIDDKEIKHRFEVISQFEPGSEATTRDLEQVRKRLAEQTRGRQPTEQNVWRIIIKSPVTKIATAAVIIFTIGLIFIHQEPREQLETVRISEVTKPPVEMMTAVSLTIAYCNEGIKGVEKQYKKAYEMLGQRKTDVSIQELLVEFNGEESKETKL